MVREMIIANALLLSFRGVVRVDVNLQDVDIDQCASDGWFAGTHRCNTTTMQVSASNTPIRPDNWQPSLNVQGQIVCFNYM